MKFLERYLGGPTTYHAEANDSELMFSRMRNKRIFSQIVGIYWRWYQQNPSQFFREMEDHLDFYVNVESQTRLQINSTKLSVTDIETVVRHFIDLEEKERTVINPYGKNPMRSSAKGIIPNYQDQFGQKKISEKVMAIVVAHEKGHIVRAYDKASVYEVLVAGFDQLRLNDVFNRDSKEYSQEDYIIAHNFRNEGVIEITERMSQLKNYFGFKADEKFTKKHLDIVKTKINGVYKYVVDTGMDNNMTLFLDLITPQTEDAFLFAINNCGI